MTSRTETELRSMFDRLSFDTPATIAEVPPHKRVLTPSEAKAAETTRVAREHTETQADQRQAQVARLREARMEKEKGEAVEAQAVAAAKAAAAAKKRVRKA
jgi:hypothetical protein